MSHLIGAGEAAARLGVSRETVSRRAKSGELQATQMSSGGYVFDSAYINSLRTRPRLSAKGRITFTAKSPDVTG